VCVCVCVCVCKNIQSKSLYFSLETTQKECLNWVLDNYKFDLYIHGLEEIASFYYKKNISERSDSELSDVITLMKKPSIINVPNREEIEQH
jgi:hypothetical protein